MEQISQKPKSFSCSIHSGETICRISKEPNAKQIGFCVECIMELDKAQKGALLSVENVIENAVKNESSKKEIRIDSPPPSSFLTTLDQESEMLSKLSNHILTQKEQVCSKFKEVQDEINMQLEKSRDKVLHTLDTHFNIFKENLGEFRKRIQRHF